LLAYLLWEIARTAIDRRLQAEGDPRTDVPASRLRTLLPLLRLRILITIIGMATMSFLAALGVDILPLLAGASVVGLAIGFGSQTLVRDVVSGAFFLMDDAFRLGEYIEVGSDKGTVEKINVRSVFLRHHRGALNILPYGEIKRLRNASRDWTVHTSWNSGSPTTRACCRSKRSLNRSGTSFPRTRTMRTICCSR